MPPPCDETRIRLLVGFGALDAAAAHAVGLRSTATIMFGHVDTVQHWARHLLHIRDLQEKTGGFTEFIPLPEK